MANDDSYSESLDGSMPENRSIASTPDTPLSPVKSDLNKTREPTLRPPVRTSLDMTILSTQAVDFNFKKKEELESHGVENVVKTADEKPLVLERDSSIIKKAKRQSVVKLDRQKTLKTRRQLSHNSAHAGKEKSFPERSLSARASIFMEDSKGSFQQLAKSSKIRRRIRKTGSRRSSVVLLDGKDESMVDAFFETIAAYNDDEYAEASVWDRFHEIFFEAINPEMPWVHYWKMIALMSVVFSILIDTFTFGFSQFFDTYVANIFSTGFDLIFAIHIYLSFRFGFWGVINGRWALCLDSRRIALKYIQSWFFLDLISIVPFYWIIDGSAGTIAGFVLIPRLLRFRQVFENRESRMSMMTGLLHNLLAFLFLAHFVACTMAYIDDNIRLEDECDNPFQKLYHNIELSSLYLSLLAYSGKSIADLGSGVVQCSLSHSFLELFTTITGMVVFATILSNINSFVSFQNLSRTNYLSNRQMLIKYLDQHGISSELQNRCERALNFGYLNRQREMDHCIDILPEHIKEELKAELFQNYLEMIPCLRFLSQNTKAILSCHIRTLYFLPRAKICSKGQPGKCCYIILRGKALCGPIHVSHDAEPEYVEIGNGEFFGEQALVLDDLYTYECDLHTVSYCEVGFLETDSLAEVLKQSKRDLNIFSSIKRYAKTSDSVKKSTKKTSAAKRIQQAWGAYVRRKVSIFSDDAQASLAANMTLHTDKSKKGDRSNSIPHKFQ